MELSSKNKYPFVFIDAHVHIYKCFDLQVFFTNAFENIQKAATQMTMGSVKKGVLYLADTQGSNWFDFFMDKAASEVIDNGQLSAFKFCKTLEPHSVEVRYTNYENIYIVASQQIVTAERLEVLALGVKERLPDGLPIVETLEVVQASGALIVLPWGVGKWLGSRGKLIKKIISSQPNKNFTLFLGDIAGRPWFWPLSAILQLARSYGYPTLSGTDPLPMATEATRVGAYGTLCRGEISSQQPAESLKRLLQTSAMTLQEYGRNENIYRFFQNQISLRLQ
jgi:hypothetical protein